ncbi:MAG: hypothetical protein ACK55I_25965, partial [bacterium]
ARVARTAVERHGGIDVSHGASRDLTCRGQRTRAEFLRQQELLRERLRAEARARTAADRIGLRGRDRGRERHAQDQARRRNRGGEAAGGVQGEAACGVKRGHG